MIESYVYYLRDVASGEVMYVGRTYEPKRRLASAKRRYKRDFSMTISHAMPIEQAKKFEVQEIKRLRPPLNVRVSSCGSTEPPEGVCCVLLRIKGELLNEVNKLAAEKMNRGERPSRTKVIMDLLRKSIKGTE